MSRKKDREQRIAWAAKMKADAAKLSLDLWRERNGREQAQLELREERERKVTAQREQVIDIVPFPDRDIVVVETSPGDEELTKRYHTGLIFAPYRRTTLRIQEMRLRIRAGVDVRWWMPAEVG